MNVVIFSQTIHAGGAERQAIYLAKALQNDCDVYFITYYKGIHSLENQRMLANLNCLYIELDGTWLHKIIFLFKFFKKKRIDVIFSYLLLPNFIGGMIGRLSNVPYPIGGIRTSRIAFSKRWINKVLQNHVNTYTIYNNSAGFLKYKKQGFNPSKAIIIPNCIETENKKIYRTFTRYVKIISVGRFINAKDYNTALEAVSILVGSNKFIKYLIVGHGPLLHQLQRWIREKGLTDYVELITNPVNLDILYMGSDIFLMTSIYEGLSNSVLEAMTYSLPLVLTDAGDNKKLVGNNNGFLCRPKDYKDIASKLVVLIKSPNLRNSFGERSFELVKSKYSFDVFKSEYLNLMNSLNEK